MLWRNIFNYVRDTVIGNPERLTPLAVAAFGQLLTAAALSAFPNNTLTDPTIEDRRDAHPASLRRAISFIGDNAHRDISLADIALACHTSIRALQEAFRRHLGTTPTAYLRRVRLDHAHHELVRSDRASATVGGIAARWGFASRSRFTTQYLAAYGVSPSYTLRQPGGEP